jgi:NAD-dependent dihydropyrimidine dehydrogenase PreA subunit
VCARVPSPEEAALDCWRCFVRLIERIVVKESACKACGICVELCPREVFDAGRDGIPLVARLDECTACLFCEWHCPDFALRVLYEDASRELAGAASAPSKEA